MPKVETCTPNTIWGLNNLIESQKYEACKLIRLETHISFCTQCPLPICMEEDLEENEEGLNIKTKQAWIRKAKLLGLL